MPTTYSHDYFGKLVYRQLPAEMKREIRKYGDLYRIGQHGPDILFYFLISKNPVTQKGVQLHRQKASDFFAAGLRRAREDHDTALLVYLLGFGCHYILDSTAHPFVNRMAREGVISHTLLEKELDRRLMEVTGKDPYHYHPSDCIRPSLRAAKVIHRAIPEIPASLIYLSLHMMKLSTNAMVCSDGGRKRRLLYPVMRLLGKKFADEYITFFMMPQRAPGSEIPVYRLEKLFYEAAQEAAEILPVLREACLHEGGLSERWEHTFNG